MNSTAEFSHIFRNYIKFDQNWAGIFSPNYDIFWRIFEILIKSCNSIWDFQVQTTKFGWIRQSLVKDIIVPMWVNKSIIPFLRIVNWSIMPKSDQERFVSFSSQTWTLLVEKNELEIILFYNILQFVVSFDCSKDWIKWRKKRWRHFTTATRIASLGNLAWRTGNYYSKSNAYFKKVLSLVMKPIL